MPTLKRAVAFATGISVRDANTVCPTSRRLGSTRGEDTTIENSLFLSYRHGAVRAAANLRDMPGSLQKPEAPAMSTQLLHGAVHGWPRRLRAPAGQVSRMSRRTSYTVSGKS